VKSEIEKLGSKALIVVADVGNIAQIQALFAKALKTFQPVDILLLDRSFVDAERHRRGIRQNHGLFAEERLFRLPGGRSDHDSLEWAKDKVNVNVVAPCITETETRRVILERPGYKEWATTQQIPAGRWNQPEDLVGAVLFPLQ
jgi:NAD(P)-dependent dehydrogenase (short-subunit alcohol dehydrogenase family)